MRGALPHEYPLCHCEDGRIRRCRLEAGPMRQASDWIAQYRRFWEHQLDALADYLEEMPPDAPSDPATT